MMAPAWVDSVVGEFGQSAGLGRISLGDKGVPRFRSRTGLHSTLSTPSTRFSSP